MTGPFEFESKSVEQTLAIGRAVARTAQAGDVVALIGDLGAGKTQFVRGMAMGLGIEPRRVTSPTFVLIQEYGAPTPDSPFLVHIDAFRLQGPEDLRATGWDGQDNELRRESIVAVEWADRVLPVLGRDRLDVQIEHVDEGRLVIITPQGHWCDRLPTLLGELAAAGVGDRARREPVTAGERSDRSAHCPVCGKSLRQGRRYAPFCSERCRTIDLGRWLDEKYVISRPLEQQDADEGH